MPKTGNAETLEESTTPVVRALLLPVGDDWYALEMTWVCEVVASPLVTALPTAPSSVLGVFNLRGEIVPLFDTAALLGLGSARDGSFAAVVDASLGPVGFRATGVPESIELGTPLGPTEMEGTAGSYAVGMRIAILLDPDVLLAPERVGGFAS